MIMYPGLLLKTPKTYIMVFGINIEKHDFQMLHNRALEKGFKSVEQYIHSLIMTDLVAAGTVKGTMEIKLKPDA